MFVDWLNPWYLDTQPNSWWLMDEYGWQFSKSNLLKTIGFDHFWPIPPLLVNEKTLEWWLVSRYIYIYIR